jgi:hypothetical protein
MNSPLKPNDPPLEQENFAQTEDKDVARLFTCVRVVYLLAVFVSIGFLGWTAHVINNGTDQISIASTSAEPSAPAEGPAASIIHPDTLRVTSISSAEPRVAIVNGQRVSEGNSVRVPTPYGTVAARVTKIADDEVEIKFAGEIIPLRLDTATTPVAR